MYQYETVQKKKDNHTGIPDRMKASFEKYTGCALDDVTVHYNSPVPSKMSALAFTQGSSVHVGPGQERYLGHELAHVVQQKQGIVHPTGEINGQPLNDDTALEAAADRMSQKCGQ